MNKLIQDIGPARTKWDRYLAHLEYSRIARFELWNPVTWIEVKDWQPSPTYLKALQAMADIEALAEEMNWK